MEAPLTINSLLNSLHTHLQTQTQLLPTLHAQLGLPQSALTDELSSLHQQLAECVERQIESRRNEVEAWMQKCDDVEKVCLRFGKALGAHVKIVGASVGELRKQQVLPIRHDMLTQYQEKLDQLYHTKLEQLSTLTNRINTLARTLGPTFYSLEITEQTLSQGELMDDVLAKRDVTPERFSRLEKELVRGKGEINRRLTQLSATMMRMDFLYSELDIAPPACDDPAFLSSSLSAPSLQRSISSSSSTDPFTSSFSAISTPTPASRSSRSTPNVLTTSDHVSEYQRIFSLFALRIDQADVEGEELEAGSLVGMEGIEPTPGLMSWAEQTKAELEEIKKRRETHIQAMYDQLETLWKRLGVEDADIDGFVDANRGSTVENVKSYESELERMLELKRERMSVFVNNARAEIESLWNDLMVGEEERADFAPFADDEHTEELLAIHENEIRKLKEERRLKAPLLASIRKYFEICEEEKELAAAASDQSRLLGRGPRDPGRLLREEKMRKRVSREKPRLEQDLLHSIPSWEDESGKPFLVNGISIVEVLMETISAADKENARKKPRAGSVPPRATTPSYSAGGGSRGTTSGAVTPAVRPGSSMGMQAQSLPNKRARVGSSTATTVNAPVSGRMNNGTPTYSQTHRAPFGNRGQELNTVGLGSESNAAASSHKPQPVTNKTPGSSLPRPIAAPKPVPPLPRHGQGYGTGIGMGYASSMREQQQNRISSSISVGLRALSASSNGDFRQSKRTARNRRESFKPRPSVDGAWNADAAGCRWTGLTEATVQEEDDY